MITFRKIQFSAAVLAAMLAATVSGTAADTDPYENYKVFLTRNPFGLKDPPPVVKAPEPTVVEEELPADLKLTGMRSVKGRVMVMFALTPAGGEMEFLSIREGERESGVEVLAGGVDVEKGTVRVKMKGIAKTLSFDDDGYQGGGGGKAPRPGARVPQISNRPRTTTGNRIPPPPSRPTTRPNSRPVPSPTTRPSTTRNLTRPIRTSSSRVTPMRSTAIPAPTAARTVRLNAGGQLTSVNPPPPQQTMSREEQALVMEATQIYERQNPQMLEVAPGKFIEITPPPIPGTR